MRFPGKKKGAIEIQFNWIFVLIVGALILVFFINISNSQRKAADQKLAFDLLSKVDLIMSGALTIPKTGQVFDMPNIPFGLECSRISMSGVSRQFPDRIIFGPDQLSGKKLIVVSQDWTVPFKISNFLYLTTSGVRYVVVANADEPAQFQTATDFLNSLPDNITKEVGNLSPTNGINDKNNYKIKLIFLSDVFPLPYQKLIDLQLPDFIKRMPNSAVSGIYIDGSSSPITVRFIKKETDLSGGVVRLNFDGEPIPVYKEPMIFGAIFAENKDEFNCSYLKAFKKLHYVSEVYRERELSISNDYSTTYSYRTECKVAGIRAPEEINAISIAATTPTQSIGTISTNEGAISYANANALRSSCAPIY